MATIQRRIELERERVYLAEVLKEASNTAGRGEKIALLRSFQNKSPETKKVVQKFMECLCHPKVVFELPSGIPPFKDGEYNDFNNSPTTLLKAFDKVKYFCRCPSFVENKVKRERIFIQILEGLYIEDANLFCMIKDKAIDAKVYPTITEKLLREAFPGIVPDDKWEAPEGEA